MARKKAATPPPLPSAPKPLPTLEVEVADLRATPTRERVDTAVILAMRPSKPPPTVDGAASAASPAVPVPVPKDAVRVMLLPTDADSPGAVAGGGAASVPLRSPASPRCGRAPPRRTSLLESQPASSPSQPTRVMRLARAPLPTRVPPPTTAPHPTRVPHPTRAPQPAQAPPPTRAPLSTRVLQPTRAPLPTRHPLPTRTLPSTQPAPPRAPLSTRAPQPTRVPLPVRPLPSARPALSAPGHVPTSTRTPSSTASPVSARDASTAASPPVGRRPLGTHARAASAVFSQGVVKATSVETDGSRESPNGVHRRVISLNHGASGGVSVGVRWKAGGASSRPISLPNGPPSDVFHEKSKLTSTMLSSKLSSNHIDMAIVPKHAVSRAPSSQCDLHSPDTSQVATSSGSGKPQPNRATNAPAPVGKPKRPPPMLPNTRKGQERTIAAAGLGEASKLPAAPSLGQKPLPEAPVARSRTHIPATMSVKPKRAPPAPADDSGQAAADKPIHRRAVSASTSPSAPLFSTVKRHKSLTHVQAVCVGKRRESEVVSDFWDMLDYEPKAEKQVAPAPSNPKKRRMRPTQSAGSLLQALAPGVPPPSDSSISTSATDDEPSTPLLLSRKFLRPGKRDSPASAPSSRIGGIGFIGADKRRSDVDPVSHVSQFLVSADKDDATESAKPSRHSRLASVSHRAASFSSSIGVIFKQQTSHRRFASAMPAPQSASLAWRSLSASPTSTSGEESPLSPVATPSDTPLTVSLPGESVLDEHCASPVSHEVAPPKKVRKSAKDSLRALSRRASGKLWNVARVGIRSSRDFRAKVALADPTGIGGVTQSFNALTPSSRMTSPTSAQKPRPSLPVATPPPLLKAARAKSRGRNRSHSDPTLCFVDLSSKPLPALVEGEVRDEGVASNDRVARGDAAISASARRKKAAAGATALLEETVVGAVTELAAASNEDDLNERSPGVGVGGGRHGALSRASTSASARFSSVASTTESYSIRSAVSTTPPTSDADEEEAAPAGRRYM